MLKITKINEFVYKVHTDNKVFGELRVDISGYFEFFDESGGFLSEHYFRTIANKLRELNEPYQNNIDLHFKSEKLELIDLFKEADWLYRMYGIHISVYPAIDSSGAPTDNFLVRIISTNKYKIKEIDLTSDLNQKQAYLAGIEHVKKQLLDAQKYEK